MTVINNLLHSSLYYITKLNIVAAAEVVEVVVIVVAGFIIIAVVVCLRFISIIASATWNLPCRSLMKPRELHLRLKYHFNNAPMVYATCQCSRLKKHWPSSHRTG